MELDKGGGAVSNSASYKAQYVSYKAQYVSYKAEYVSYKAQYVSYKAQYVSYKAEYVSYKAEYVSYKVQYVSYKAQYVSYEAEYVSYKAQYVSYKAQYVSYEAEYVSYNAQYVSYKAEYVSYKAEYVSYKAQYVSYKAQYVSYEAEYVSYKAQYVSYKAQYVSYEAEYVSYKAEYVSYKAEYVSYKAQYVSYKAEYVSYKAQYVSYKAEYVSYKAEGGGGGSCSQRYKPAAGCDCNSCKWDENIGTWRGDRDPQFCRSMPLILRVQWMIINLAYNSAFVVTTAYWGWIVFIVDDRNLHKTTMNQIKHTANTLYVLLDVMVMATPFRLFHMFFAITLGSCYVLFNGFFFLNGESLAMDTATHVPGTTTTPGQVSSRKLNPSTWTLKTLERERDAYNYLNWHAPVEAIITCVMAMFLCVLSQLLLFLLFRLRLGIWQKMYGARGWRMESELQNIVLSQSSSYNTIDGDAEGPVPEKKAPLP
ncbi:hypothetical protein ACOMHN_009706 [Nucella lapillus]